MYFHLVHSETKAYPLSISQDKVRRFLRKGREMKDLEKEQESKESLRRKKEHRNWNDQLILGLSLLPQENRPG